MKRLVFVLIALAGCPKSQDASTTVIPIPSAGTATTTTTATATETGTGTVTATATGTPQAGNCPIAGPGSIDPSLPGGSCKSDKECNQGLNGRCGSVYVGHGRNVNACTYDECAVDADCKKDNPQTLCLCGGGVRSGRNACVEANCHDDSECHGRKCGVDGNGRDPRSFCRTALDVCKSDADCPWRGRACGYAQAAKRWECVERYIRPPG